MHQLPANAPTFEAFVGERCVFRSAAHWLYPLFEFEAFLEHSDLAAADLLIHDKVVGRAAALLLCRLGVRRVHAEVMSEPGRAVFSDRGIEFRAGQVVPRIACATETLLLTEQDPDMAYAVVRERMSSDRGSE